ncbi:MAG: amidophosphoribosyltransferase [Clostridia bacterium]|nr:amidophosphoribosyltransferase [Clostridia bacterium]
METERSLREKCGVFGVFGHPEAPLLTREALLALQHRGQESAGITVATGGELRTVKGMGLVPQAVPEGALSPLRGTAAIGHVRYSTTGASELQNAHPLAFLVRETPVAIAHNGNLVNAVRLRRELAEAGALFQTSTDTETIVHELARRLGGPDRDWLTALGEALLRVAGAYALVLLVPGALYAARDPLGIRPLALGRLGPAWLVASESCAFDAVGAAFVREIEPGEIVRLDAGGLQSARLPAPRRALCVFELIYFARPDSQIGGISVHEARKRLGRRLAQAAPAEADVVLGVPDSSLPAALGFAEASGLPFELGLIKNRYVGRTFILPSEGERRAGVRLKLNPVPDVVRGRRVVLVDDSIVRGTTARRLVEALRQAGAAAVHLRVTAPPYRHPCYYGIDTSLAEELVARSGSVEEVRALVGADSLAYLGLEDAIDALGMGDGFCHACFSGQYPVPVGEAGGKRSLETGVVG